MIAPFSYYNDYGEESPNTIREQSITSTVELSSIGQVQQKVYRRAQLGKGENVR